MEINIKDEIRYRGCKPNPQIITPSQELFELYELLNRCINFLEKNRKAKFCEEIKAGRTFLNEMYKIHDVPWSYYKKTLIWEINVEGYISPFSLPIKRVKGEIERYGLLKEEITLSDVPTISYKRIEVFKETTEALSSTYIHEITHTQQNHIPELIEDYYDTETLSIFNELLYASYKTEKYAKSYDTSRIQDIIKGLELLFRYKDNIKENYDTLLEACCYLVSTLKAYHLFYIYYYGNTSTKKHILKKIQKVFNHRISVEECLTSLDISYENSLNIQKLERVLNR